MKWLAAGVTLFILYAIYLANTGTPNIFDDIIRWIPQGDKIGHFVMMGLLALVVNLAMGDKPCCRWKIGRWAVLSGTLIVAFFVTLEEFSQMFVATRTFNPLDLLADYLGMGVANVAACWHFSRSESSGGSNPDSVPLE